MPEEAPPDEQVQYSDSWHAVLSFTLRRDLVVWLILPDCRQETAVPMEMDIGAASDADMVG